MVSSGVLLLLLRNLCFVSLFSYRAFSLPSCDEPQSITITRGQKISVVYWLGQNQSEDHETVLDIDTTEFSDDVSTDAKGSSRVPLEDPSSTLPLDSDETTTNTTISSTLGYHSDGFKNEQTTESVVRMDPERDSRSSVSDDVSNQSSKSDETSLGSRGGRDDETDVTSSSSSLISTEENGERDEVSSDGTESSLMGGVTESWAIVFTDLPKDLDILVVDPRDPAINNHSTEDSTAFPNNLDDVAANSTVETDLGDDSKESHLVERSSLSTSSSWKMESDGWVDEGKVPARGTKPVFLERALTLPPASGSESEVGIASVLGPSVGTNSSSLTGGDSTLTGDYNLSTKVPPLPLLHESPVHYVTVVRSPDGTLPMKSLNSNSKRHTSRRQLIRNERSTNGTLCKWIFKSDPGVPLLLTFKTFSTPETSDCKDHYIAVERESNGFQSRWCGVSGDRPGHSSFARSEISLYLSSSGDGSYPTGFSVEVQALDVKLLRKYAEVRRIIKSQ